MKARKALHEMELKKTGHNKFAGYYYFELGDFMLPAIKVFDDIGLAGYVSYEKEMAYLKIVDLEDNSEIVISSPMASAALKGAHDVQNLGAVQTYLRRYLWVTALEIVEHDALDSSKPNDSAKGHGVIKPTDGAKDSLTPEEKKVVKDIASTMVDYISAGDMATAAVFPDAAPLSAEQRVYLWTFFDSTQRRGMKAAKQQMAMQAAIDKRKETENGV